MPSITLTDAQSTTLSATQGLITGTSASFSVASAAANTMTATSGASQTAGISQAFTNPLVATVTDTYGNPVSGVSVTFTGPSTGASETFATCTSNPQTYACTQSTGSNGQATSSTFTANATAGSYSVTASATGLTSVTYAETNRSTVTVLSSNSANSGGSTTTQSVTLGSTPSSGSTIVVLVYAYATGGKPSTPTISGNITGSATAITNVSPGGNYLEWAFWAKANGSGATYTATFTGRTPQDIELDVVALSGNNTTTPIAQNKTNTGTSASPTATLTAAPAAGDMEIAFMGSSSNSGGVGSTPTGWTNIENKNSGTPAYGVASYDTNTNGSTSQAFSFSNSVGWAAIALDIAHA
jgi:hypothetical protein